jgi:hypothetical protein
MLMYDNKYLWCNMSSTISIKHKKSFFSWIVFGGTEVPIVYILLYRPSEDSPQGSAIPDGSPSKDWQSTVGWELLDSNPGLQLHNLVSLPMSHHCFPKEILLFFHQNFIFVEDVLLNKIIIAPRWQKWTSWCQISDLSRCRCLFTWTQFHFY